MALPPKQTGGLTTEKDLAGPKMKLSQAKEDGIMV